LSLPRWALSTSHDTVTCTAFKLSPKLCSTRGRPSIMSSTVVAAMSKRARVIGMPTSPTPLLAGAYRDRMWKDHIIAVGMPVPLVGELHGLGLTTVVGGA